MTENILIGSDNDEDVGINSQLQLTNDTNFSIMAEMMNSSVTCSYTTTTTTIDKKNPKSKPGLKARRGAVLPQLDIDENTLLFLPHDDVPPTPSPATAAANNHPLKKRARLSFAYDKNILMNTFGPLDGVAMNNNYIRREGVDLSEYTFRYLKKNIMFKINDGSILSCFMSRNGALAMFDVPHKDIEALNNLLKFLLDKINMDSSKVTLSLLSNMDTIYVRADRLSNYFLRNGRRIQELPNCNFEANVALKIMGIQFYRRVHPLEKEATTTTEERSEVKLLMHLDQVRIANTCNGKENETCEPICMFTD